MTLVTLVAALALAIVAATGGGRDLAAVRVRAVRLLVAAAVIQVGTAVLVPASQVARVLALVLAVVLVGLFLVGNRLLPGVALVAAGLLANVVVVGVNAAMPVSLAAAERAGLTRSDLRLGEDPLREASGPGTRLPLLGDTIPVALPWRPQVVSPGDVLVAAGVGLLLLTAGRHRAGSRPGQPVPSRAERSTVLASDSTTRGSYS